MGYWKKASREAYASALKGAKIDTWESRVGLIFGAAIVAGTTWLATGDAGGFIRAAATIAAPLALLLLFFVIKLIGAPPRLEVAALEVHAKERKELEAKAESLQANLDRLTSEITRLKAPPPPPPRNPDGIYQVGKMVGRAVGVTKMLGENRVYMNQLHDGGEFFASDEFEYHDLRLTLESAHSFAQSLSNGLLTQCTHFQVVCRVLGRAGAT